MVHVARDRDRGVDLANIEGPLSQIRGSAIRTTLLELVATGPGKLVLNLAGVTFVDSHGLATLVSVWKAMSRREGRVVLSAIPSDIEALIELTRLQSLFEIFPSDATAIVNLELQHTASDRELRVPHPLGQPDRPTEQLSQYIMPS
jgi:anti-sigma B factor antagonist